MKVGVLSAVYYFGRAFLSGEPSKYNEGRLNARNLKKSARGWTQARRPNPLRPLKNET